MVKLAVAVIERQGFFFTDGPRSGRVTTAIATRRETHQIIGNIIAGLGKHCVDLSAQGTLRQDRAYALVGVRKKTLVMKHVVTRELCNFIGGFDRGKADRALHGWIHIVY
tara:strand:+ start:8469 stop:8798 length:330 start_codon:yes stop_codon:yes gene_type:complete